MQILWLPGDFLYDKILRAAIDPDLATAPATDVRMTGRQAMYTQILFYGLDIQFCYPNCEQKCSRLGFCPECLYQPIHVRLRAAGLHFPQCLRYVLLQIACGVLVPIMPGAAWGTVP